MSSRYIDERALLANIMDAYVEAAARHRVTFQIRQDFGRYVAVRHAHGDTHLNQAFHPAFTKFNKLDFWILAENPHGEAIATFCMRHFEIDNFYALIRSQALWFGARLRSVSSNFLLEYDVPPFGGKVVHGGGLWVRGDHRGFGGLAKIIPRFARCIAFQNWPAEHDSAMIRGEPSDTPQVADRKAAFMGVRTYGFSRVGRFVNGWFPPEGREAVMHLCHATRAEALSTLSPASLDLAAASKVPGSDPARLSARADGRRPGRSLRAAG